MVKACVGAEQSHLLYHLPWRAHIVAVAVDRLCAPVALVRTTTRSGDIDRKIAAARHPGIAVGREIDKIPGRKRKTVQLAQHRAWRGFQHSILLPQRKAIYGVRSAALFKRTHQLGKG